MSNPISALGRGILHGLQAIGRNANDTYYGGSGYKVRAQQKEEERQLQATLHQAALLRSLVGSYEPSAPGGALPKFHIGDADVSAPTSTQVAESFQLRKPPIDPNANYRVVPEGTPGARQMESGDWVLPKEATGAILSAPVKLGLQNDQQEFVGGQNDLDRGVTTRGQNLTHQDRQTGFTVTKRGQDFSHQDRVAGIQAGLDKADAALQAKGIGGSSKPPAALVSRDAQANTLMAGAKALLEGDAEFGIPGLNNPQVREHLGPIMGRVTHLSQLLGDPDPTTQTFISSLQSWIAGQPGMHGFRGKAALDKFEEYMGPMQTPESLAAGIHGFSTFANIYLKTRKAQDAASHAPRAPTPHIPGSSGARSAPKPGERRQMKDGKWAVWSGTTFKAEP